MDRAIDITSAEHTDYGVVNDPMALIKQRERIGPERSAAVPSGPLTRAFSLRTRRNRPEVDFRDTDVLNLPTIRGLTRRHASTELTSYSAHPIECSTVIGVSHLVFRHGGATAATRKPLRTEPRVLVACKAGSKLVAQRYNVDVLPIAIERLRCLSPTQGPDDVRPEYDGQGAQARPRPGDAESRIREYKSLRSGNILTYSTRQSRELRSGRAVWLLPADHRRPQERHLNGVTWITRSVRLWGQKRR
jgi:hypothetical protein